MKQRPMIGVLSPLVGGFYFGAILTGIERAARGAGAQVLAIQTHDSGLSSAEHLMTPSYRSSIAWNYISGWLVVVNAASEEYLADLRRLGMPVVLISHETVGGGYPTVQPDNCSGIRAAVSHLIQHGHRRIAFAGNLIQRDIRDRYATYRESLLEHGIQPDPHLFFETDDNSETGGQQAAQKMLAAGLPSTAVIAATDLNAIGMMTALQAAGCSLPKDQAIVGFDDLEVAPYTRPSLSSIRQQFELIGIKAIQLLLAQLAGQPVAATAYYVPTTFIQRDSCGCLSVLARAPEAVEAPPGRSWRAELSQRLLRVFSPIDQMMALEPSAVQSSIQQIVEALDAALHDRPVSPDDLSQVWSSICQSNPYPEAVQEIIQAVVQAGRQITAVHSQAAALRFEDFLNEMIIGLTRAQLREQFADRSGFHALLRSHFEISIDLLRSHERDIRSLAWMRWTKARAACFGMWVGDAPGRELELVGVFSRDEPLQHLQGRRYTLDSFPPTEIVALPGRVPGDAVFVIPVKIKSSDWGLIALAGPIETKFATGRETFNQWAALLTVALDHEAVLQSLREQRAHLALAYRRERELVESIRVSEERYALAADAANDGLWDWNLIANQIYYSSRWKAMLGYAEAAVGTSPDEWLSRVHPDDRASLAEAITHHIQGSTPALEYEHRLLGSDGTYRWVLCRGQAVRDPLQRATRMVGSLTDITDRKRLEERLRHDALYDSLTDLPNRTLFLDRLGQAIGQVKRHAEQIFAVLFLDLDGFKIVNDSLGHLVGDQLLIGVAGRLSAHLGASDTAARFGGDEFAILLHNIRDMGELSRIAERIQSHLSEPFQLMEHEVVITASIGIAVILTGYERAEDVLRDADIAMYRAKALGKRTHTVFDVAMHARAVKRLRLEAELRRAIDHHEFELHYQPIVLLSNSQIVGFEALIRWRHPERGLISPVEFLPVAEETGLIIPIGRWCIAETCRQIRAWQDDIPSYRDLSVSVNVSHKQFWYAGLIEQIAAALRANCLEARHLTIEITEGVIMSNPDAARTIIQQFHDHALHLHIDDFGTGYSSLEALHRFPIEALKIDRSFVSRLGQDHRSTEIVRTIIMMGRNLGMEVIAEGIETAEQQQHLRELGCHYGQGYLFAQPVCGADVRALLERQSRYLHAMLKSA